MYFPHHDTKKDYRRLVLLLCVASIGALLLSGCSEYKIPPVANGGVLDLTDWDFEEDGIVSLDCQWEFYWKRLLGPENFAAGSPVETAEVFNVPGLWGGHKLMQSPYPGDGFTTYRLNVKVNPQPQILALRVGLIQTAYKIWINGRFVAEQGVVGTDPQASQAQARIGLYDFTQDGDNLAIIIQVSNFFQSRGGMRGHLTLGKQSDVHQNEQALIAFDLTVFGCLAIMGAYLLVLFLFRTEDRSPLYYGIVCLFMAVSTLVHGMSDGAFYAFSLFNPSYETHTKIAYYCVTLGFPFFLLFLYALFPHEWSQKKLWSFLVASFLVHFLLVFLPIRTFCDYIIVLEVLSLLGVVYMAFVCAKAVVHRNQGALFLSVGIVLIFLTAFYDFLIDTGALHGPQLTNLSLLICTLLNSLFISWRFSMALTSVKSLSERLTLTNVELHRLDKLRDQALNRATIELEKNRELNRNLDQKVKDRTKKLKEKNNLLTSIEMNLTKYLPVQLVNSIKYDSEEAIPETKRIKLTMLLSDIKDFTQITDAMEPEDMAKLLNEYLTEMNNIIDEYDGTLAQITGDNLLVFFGAPAYLNDKDHAIRCVNMAINMQVQMLRLQKNWFNLGIDENLRIRCGINTGMATVGSFGSNARKLYTAHGMQVNIAARLEQACDPDGILISHTTWALVKDEIECTDRGQISIKGYHKPVRIYCVETNSL